MNSPKHNATAFTLIELLTVIAIIGILAAIIIPTVGKVRESARTATCLSNMRQLANAMQLYANDNKGILPPADTGSWPDNYVAKLSGAGTTPKGPDYVGTQGNVFDISKGVQTIFLCQSNIRSVASPRTNAATTYGMNTRASAKNINTAMQPSRLCLIGDATGRDWDMRMQPDGPDYRRPTNKAHNGKYHFAFLDGHAASQTSYPETSSDDNFNTFWNP
ncbi:prepilin-type N-terminal cleavage/methylation domain-containing protein [Opitutaceae bacterium TAV1]|nr:prepilin-type N-terminal cleavage/methylation domain-containing protein [Opitutaceae bacterium TAV1]